MACETIGILIDDRLFHITSCHWTGYLPNPSSLLTHFPNQQLFISSMASSSRVNASTGRQVTRRVFQGAIRSRGSARGATPFVFNEDLHNVSVLIVTRVPLLTSSCRLLVIASMGIRLRRSSFDGPTPITL